MSSKAPERIGDFDRVIAETTLRTRGDQFASEFKLINDELISFVEECSDEDWQRSTSSEGWSIAAVAHHIAVSVPAFYGIVETLAAGQPLAHRISMDAVNAGNAQHAREYADVGKDVVLNLLRIHGEETAKQLSGLTDEQLQNSTDAFGDRELSLSQFTEMVVIGHSRIHLESMKKTLGR